MTQLDHDHHRVLLCLDVRQGQSGSGICWADALKLGKKPDTKTLNFGNLRITQLHATHAVSQAVSATSQQGSLTSRGRTFTPVVCLAVGVWLDGSDAQGYLSSVDAKFNLMKEINNQLSVAQPDQLSAQQGAEANDYGGVDSSITLDLTVDVELGGGERLVRRGVTIGTSDLSSSIAELTAEVDFEVGPDVSGESELLGTYDDNLT